MRFLLLLCIFLFSFQSCTLPTSSNTGQNSNPSTPTNPPSGSGGSFILNETNLDKTVWGFYDPAVQRTYLLGFYSLQNRFLGVYCEAQTASTEEAVKMMEERAQQNPSNYVFPTQIQKDYVEVFGPGVNFRLSPLNQQEAVYSVIINDQVSSAHSMKRFR